MLSIRRLTYLATLSLIPATTGCGYDSKAGGERGSEGEGEGEGEEGEGEGETGGQCALGDEDRRGECDADPELEAPGEIDVIGTLKDFRTNLAVGGEEARVRLRLLRPSVVSLGVTGAEYGFEAPCEDGAFAFPGRSITQAPTGISANDFDCDSTDLWVSTFTATYPTGVVPDSLTATTAYVISNADVATWDASLAALTGQEDIDLLSAPDDNGCLIGRAFDLDGVPYAGAKGRKGSDDADAFYFNEAMDGFVPEGAATTASGAFLLVRAGLGNYGIEDTAGTLTYKSVLGKGGSDYVCVVADFHPLAP
jgi:hypothetical protein